MLYEVEDRVFEKYPQWRGGLVVVLGACNSAHIPELEAMLRDAEEGARADALADYAQHPRLDSWNRLFTQMGINPKRYPPSVVNLIKRTRSGKNLPFVSPLVAIFNYISIKHMIPCGGDNMAVVLGHLRLGLAAGDEQFSHLGQPERKEPPKPGEVIYYDTGTKEVFCRAWCWKNGDTSKITDDTRFSTINVDASDAVSDQELHEITEELAALARRFTGARTLVHYFTRQTPRFEFEVA